MRKYLLIAFLFAFVGVFGQQNDTTKYFRSVDYGWQYKRLKVDSILMLPNGVIINRSFKFLTASDTAAMLSPYLRKIDTSAMLTPYRNQINTNTANISSNTTNIALKVNISDTASMLSGYYRSTNPAGYITSSAITGKVNYTDTASMLSGYYRSSNPSGYITSAAIAGKVNYTDTAAMLSGYMRQGSSPDLSSVVKYTDTAAMLSSYYNKTATDSKLALKVNYTDTASMLSHYAKTSDLPSLTGVVKYTDTASMLNPYGRVSNGANFRIPYYTGSQTFSGSDSLRWDYSNLRLHLGTPADYAARMNVYTYGSKDAIHVRGATSASGKAFQVTSDTGGGTVLSYISMQGQGVFNTGGSSYQAIGLQVNAPNGSTFRVNGDETVYIGEVGAAPFYISKNGTVRYLYNNGGGGLAVQSVTGNIMLGSDVDSSAYKVQVTGSTLLKGVAKYATNYGSLFDARSLVNKGYVDSANALRVKYSDTASMLSSYYNKTAADALLATKQTQLNGTGFVKASGTTISYDNSSYMPVSTAVSYTIPKYNSNNTAFITSDITNSSSGQVYINGSLTTANYIDVNSGAIGIWGNSSNSNSSPYFRWMDWSTSSRDFAFVDTLGTLKMKVSTAAQGDPYMGSTIFSLSSAGAGTFASSATASNFILSGGTGNTGLYYGHTNKVVLANYVTGGGIDFETNGGTVNMTLDGSANLSVVGSGTFGSSVTATGFVNTSQSAFLLSSGNNNDFRFNSSSDVFRIINAANNYAIMTVLNGGNVGIGTTSPNTWGTNLVIYNNQATITGGGYDGTFADYLYFGGNSEGTTYRNKISNSLSATTSNQKMKFSVANGASTWADVMTLVGNGNVGIGTTSPGVKLQVNDNQNASTLNLVNTSSYNANLRLLGSNQSSYFLDIASGSSAHWIWGSGTADMLFGTSGSERMRITSNGKVLINTTTSTGSGGGDRALELSGNIFSKGADAGYFWVDRTGSLFAGWYTTSSTIYLYSSSAGNIASINTSSGSYTALSDVNKKKDFEASTIGLDAIMNLKPTLFRMKTEGANTPKQLGFIAQEVKPFIPQAYVEQGDFIGLQDRPIIAALVKAIQEQQQQINELKAQLNK